MNDLTGTGSQIDRTAATHRIYPTLATALTTLVLLGGTAHAWADVGGLNGGRISGAEQQQAIAPVLPAHARPFGYSLDDMARLVAPFNVSDRSDPPPNSPFQILYTTKDRVPTFDVGQGKFLYVPLVYNDDSAPVMEHFPANAQNRQQSLRFWYSQSAQGATAQQLIIDGKTVPLGAAYLSGLSFNTPLSDGAKQYLTVGAFISPLSRGAHTVEIYFKATGDALREPPFDQYYPDGFVEYRIPYNVNVR